MSIDAGDLLLALTAGLAAAVASPWLALVWLAYVGVLAAWIVRQRREPVATLAWLLALAWLPVIGWAVYWWLGPQRIQRRQLKRGRARLALSQAALPACGEPAEWGAERLVEATTGFGPTRATRLDLLTGGESTYGALFGAIAAARETIHLEYYIFEPDGVGTRLRDLLAERARAGVEVRLLLDGLGSRRCSPRFLATLRETGAEVGWFHPIALSPLLWRPTLNLRTHRKIAVIDGRIGFTGGVNISDTQSERASAAAFHDLHLRLEGDVVRALQLVFAEDWHYATGRALTDPRHWPAQAGGDIRCQLVPSGPDHAQAPIHRLFVEAIHGARQRVWMMTPYFVPDAPVLLALTSAALRGLDVRVLLPRRNDNRLVRAAARSFYPELLAAGVRIDEFQPRMLHGKALLIDDDTALIGSANVDPRSFFLNFELSVLARDTDVAAALAGRIAADLALSVRVDPRWRPRGVQAYLDSAARLLAPLL
ncbi:MAG: cardiolipin synthase [Lysobacteraceae bacterium]|jgi:cardiolipin synthase|nr:cardiolipin synthase [Xanthomonadaceae bacterium]MCZ8319545.1 cardiolipin synthase [Silanimonas sp.]